MTTRTRESQRKEPDKTSSGLQLPCNTTMSLSGREAIPFTVKGPIPVHLPESNGDRMGRTRCSILELSFQYPCQIGELVFSNYYTAWMSVFVKRMANKIKTFPPTEKEISSCVNFRARPVLDRSFSIDVPGNGERSGSSLTTWSPLPPPMSSSPLAGSDLIKENQILQQRVAGGGAGALTTCDDDFDSLELKMDTLGKNCLQQMSLSKRRHSSGSLSSETAAASETRPWELSIEKKNFMPWPHFEYGGQEHISVPATESIVEWRDVLVMRLVLHQPSTVWKRFAIDELDVFRHLPKRGFSHCDDLMRQRDNWFSVLKMNTKAVLAGQLVEPENTTVSDDGMTT